MKPVCVPCRRFYRPSKNGRAFVENMPRDNDAPPGLEAPERWRPYKLWCGDEWTCQGCGAKIIVGVGATPLAEHFFLDFEKRVADWEADLSINDC